MTGIKFYRDKNGSRNGGWNGLAVFTDDRIKRGHKSGWWGITANQPGAGDGPYVDTKVSKNYLSKNCEPIDEAAARREFPALVASVEEIKKEETPCQS